MEATRTEETGDPRVEVKLWLSPSLARAWQRCLWVLAQETGRDRIELMDEAVRDFLIKHRC